MDGRHVRQPSRHEQHSSQAIEFAFKWGRRPMTGSNRRSTCQSEFSCRWKLSQTWISNNRTCEFADEAGCCWCLFAVAPSKFKPVGGFALLADDFSFTDFSDGEEVTTVAVRRPSDLRTPSVAKATAATAAEDIAVPSASMALDFLLFLCLWDCFCGESILAFFSSSSEWRTSHTAGTWPIGLVGNISGATGKKDEAREFEQINNGFQEACNRPLK